MPMLMYPKLKEASLIPRLKKTFFLDMDKEYGLYDKDRRGYFTAGMLHLMKQHRQSKMMSKMLQKINHLQS